MLTAFAALVPQAVHPMSPVRAMTYDVGVAPAGYEVREEGDVLATSATIADACEAIYVRAYRRAFELASLTGWVRVHGATVDLDGERVLLVGPSGCGKTTLALRLLFDGVAVQGDESVLVRPGASLAVPRAFHVKAGTERFVPELAAMLDGLVHVDEVAVLDPNVIVPWRLAERPIDRVVLVERGNGPASIRPAGSAEVLEAALHHAFPVTESTAALVRTLAGSTASARGHRLTFDEPAAAIRTLKQGVR